MDWNGCPIHFLIWGGMDLDPTKWGGLELGLKICPVKTSSCRRAHDKFESLTTNEQAVFRIRVGRTPPWVGGRGVLDSQFSLQ